MSAAPTSMRSILIPLQGLQVLLPSSAIVEIIDHREAEPIADAPAWQLGVSHWNQRELPIISLEKLLGCVSDAVPRRRRIVVCHALGGAQNTPYLGIVSAGIPRLHRLEAGGLQLESLDAAWQDLPIHAALKVGDERVLIPDLEGLARQL